MRRDFALLENDRDYLDRLGSPWEAIAHGGEYWLLVHDFALPAGYRIATVSVAIKIEPGYPMAQLDMAYFHPAIQRTDGKPIPCAEAVQHLDGKPWQRWSRHRTGANPWTPGDDSLETHLILVRDWLVREFERR